MEIQTLSIVVPVKGRCVNKCPFCVSGMHESQYVNQIEDNERFYGLYREDYIERMAFARDNGCNTAILTGDGEPMQNKNFLKHFSDWNDRLPSMGSKRFRHIDLQTSGALLRDQELRFLRNDVRVSTIAVSVVDIFSSENNALVMGQPPGAQVEIATLAEEIKRYDFNLRFSVNLTSLYTDCNVEAISSYSTMVTRIQSGFGPGRGLSTPTSRWTRSSSTLGCPKTTGSLCCHRRSSDE